MKNYKWIIGAFFVFVFSTSLHAATLQKGKTFTANETVTNTKLHSLVDDATISDIEQSDVKANYGFMVKSSSQPSDTDALWNDTSANTVKAYISGSWQEVSGIVAGNLDVTGNTLMTGTLGVTGITTLSNVTISSNLSVSSVTRKGVAEDLTGGGVMTISSDGRPTAYAFGSPETIDAHQVGTTGATLTSGTTYTAGCDGFINAQATRTTGTASLTLTINSVAVDAEAPSVDGKVNVSGIVKKGTTWVVTVSSITLNQVVFTPITAQ